MRKCNFVSIADQFNFGRYNGLSLADVLDINPSYLSWCVKHCTGVIFQLEDEVLEEVKIVYPNFIMDNLFAERRIWQLYRTGYEDLEEYENHEGNEYSDNWDEYNSNYEDSNTYERYSGSWAQDVEGYSDDDIDAIFDGDPSAYWNID